MESIRDRLKDIALTDIVNSRRTSDTLREGFVSALLQKTGEMTPAEILDAIDRIDKPPIQAYQEVLGMIDNA